MQNLAQSKLKILAIKKLVPNNWGVNCQGRVAKCLVVLKVILQLVKVALDRVVTGSTHDSAANHGQLI